MVSLVSNHYLHLKEQRIQRGEDDETQENTALPYPHSGNECDVITM